MSMELSMIFGLVSGGCELNAERRTADGVSGVAGAAAGAAGAAEAAEAVIEEEVDAKAVGHFVARKEVERSGKDCGTCERGNGGGSNATCDDGAVRGRSMLTRSANDGAEGGTTGNGGIGTSVYQWLVCFLCRWIQQLGMLATLTWIVRCGWSAQTQAVP